MPLVNKKKFDYTVEGLKQAEIEASKTGAPVQSDQSVYGPTNANPMINPDSNTLMTSSRDTSKRRKPPRPYKTNRNI